jgi:hypothetical protein
MVGIHNLAVLSSFVASAVAQGKFQYSALTGYFMQDDAATDPSTFDYVGYLVISS